MKYGRVVNYPLTYFYEGDRILPGIIGDLDILFIPGIFRKCGDWHASFTFSGPKVPPIYGISPHCSVINLALWYPKNRLTEFAVLLPFGL